MTVQIENEGNFKFPFHYKKIARDVIEQTLEQEKCPYEAEVNLTLTGNDIIRETNRDFRNIDRVTDVLSFPMQNFEHPADFTFLEEDNVDSFNPETGELLLGDIMVCVPRAEEQAESYGHALKREYAFLIAHSMLHLLGYDHMHPEEAKIMEEKQENVLRDLGITR